MSRSSRTSSSAGVSTPGAILAGAAAALVVALVVAAGGSAGVADPSAPPSPSPVVSPSPSPSVPAKPAKPVVTPGPDGVDGAHFPLDVFGDHDVTLDIADPDGYLVDAGSGTAKDGMSVRWGTAQVRNRDERTIEVTWVGLPGDEAVTLVVRPAAGDGLILRFGQVAPPAYSDAMGADRVVVLTFANPISAERIVTDFTTADD